MQNSKFVLSQNIELQRHLNAKSRHSPSVVASRLVLRLKLPLPDRISWFLLCHVWAHDLVLCFHHCLTGCVVFCDRSVVQQLQSLTTVCKKKKKMNRAHLEMRALPLSAAKPTSWWIRQLHARCCRSKRAEGAREGAVVCCWGLESLKTERSWTYGRLKKRKGGETWEALWWTPARKAPRKCPKGGKVCGLTCQ